MAEAERKRARRENAEDEIQGLNREIQDSAQKYDRAMDHVNRLTKDRLNWYGGGPANGMDPNWNAIATDPHVMLAAAPLEVYNADMQYYKRRQQDIFTRLNNL